MKKIISLVLCALLVLSCASAEGYVPGRYTETAEGNNGAVTLTVVTNENGIESIKLGAHSETAGLGDVAMNSVIAAIVEKGSADVDAVSGATYSSNAVIAAVKAALLRAEVGDVDEEAEAVAPAMLTFADQCRIAGIDFTYVDPNADIYDFTSTNPDVDVLTHASGPAKYVDETEGPCLKTPADLVARTALKAKVYFWAADENGVATLEEAAKLEDACYVSYPFPADGNKYAIKLQSNSIGTNVVCTVNADGEPTAAVFGMKYVLGDNGVDAYTSVAIMAETATYDNIMAGSTILITYYEYNPYSEKKIGVGTRNAGARVFVEMDKDLSTLTMEADENGVKAKMTVAEYMALDDEARAKLQVRSITLKAKIVEFNSIG